MNIFVTVLVLGAGFGIYLWVQPSRPRTEVRSRPTTIGEIRPNEGNLAIGGGERPWVKNYDQNGNVDTQFRADEYTPRKDGTVYVTRPQATFFMAGGQQIRLEARDGVIVVDESPEAKGGSVGMTGPTQAPRRGQLFGVTMQLVNAPAKDEAVLSLQEINNLTFDADTLRIFTEGYGRGAQAVAGDQVPVKIDGVDYAFEGTGLTIRWSDVDKRLELLEIAHGKQLVIKDPSRVANPIAPKAVPSPRADAKRDELLEPPVAVDFAPSPGTPGEGGVRVLPHASSDRDGTLTPALSRRTGRGGEDDREPNRPLPMMIASADDSTPALPKADLPPAIYRAAFLNDVRVVQSEQTIVHGDVMNVEFYLRDSRAIAATQPAPATRPAAGAAAGEHSPASDIPPATAPSVVATQQASQARQAPIYVYWRGPLRVTPVKESVVPLSPGDSAVQMIGSPLKVSRDGNLVDCSSFVFRTRTQELSMLPSEKFPVITMRSADGANLTTRQMDYDGVARRVMLRGESDAKILTGRKQGDADEVLDAHWTDTGEIYFNAAGQGETASIEKLKLAGDVRVVHPRSKFEAKTLELGFASARPKEIALRSLSAGGDVRMTDSEREMSAGSLNVTFAPRAVKAGEAEGFDASAIEDLIAQDDVAVKLQDGAIAKADRLTIATRDGDSKIELSGRDASVTDKNGTTLSGEKILISTKQQTAGIPGRGRLHAQRPGDGGGAGRPIDVTWTGGATASGSTNLIEITGDVKATSTEPDGAVSTATGGRLIVTLKDAKSGDEAKAASKPADGASPRSPVENKQVASIALRDGAEMKSVLSAADGSVVRRVNLFAEQIDYDMPARRVSIPVPGRMLVEDHSKPMAADDAAKQKLSPAQSGATAFAWKKSLIYDEASRKAVMSGDVVVVHQPDDAAASPMRLEAQSVTARFAPADANAPQGRVDLKEITADGNLRFTMRGLQFEAESLTYEPASDELTASGTDQSPAVLFNDQGISTGSFRRLRYNMKSGEMKMEDFRANVR